MQNKFFNSKLNTILLAILIILMIIALYWMNQNKGLYFLTLRNQNTTSSTTLINKPENNATLKSDLDYMSPENLIEYTGDSRISFKYDKNADIHKMENPVYGDEVIWLGIGQKKLKGSSNHYEVDLEYDKSSTSVSDFLKYLPTNVKYIGEKKIGKNLFIETVYDDTINKTRVFSLYENGGIISIGVPEVELFPKYIDLSSVTINSNVLK